MCTKLNQPIKHVFQRDGGERDRRHAISQSIQLINTEEVKVSYCYSVAYRDAVPHAFTYESRTLLKLQAPPKLFQHNHKPSTNTTPSIAHCHGRYPGSNSNMAVQTRQQARAQVGDSDPLEESRELPPVSSRPSLNKKRTASNPLQKSENTDGEHNLLLDLPPELRIAIYEYCVAAEGPFHMIETIDVKPSRLPDLLKVNRQTREEALPIFYKTNEFSFGRCRAKYITQWLFRAVQPQHLELINAISWTSQLEKTKWYYGPPRDYNDVVAVYSKAAQDQAIDLSSVVMLLELGLLGPCKVKMALYNEPRLHVACRLREMARKTIARKTLTRVDAWNENNVPGEYEVAGLAYAMARDWGNSAPQAFQDRSSEPPLAHEMYCSSCQTVSTSRDSSLDGMVSRLPWVSQSEGDETTADQSGKESSIGADQ